MSTLSPNGWAFLTTLVVVWVGWQLLSARIWPWTSCRHCNGGVHRNEGGNGPYWRLCRKCGGKGVKQRLLYRLVWHPGR